MEKYPFISIINPVRNAERTLGMCFESLLKVEYPHDRMEIVMADGGSTDRTVEIIREWQARYPLIKLVVVPNSKSPGHARNAALKMARGDFILFTDADCAPRKDWANKLLAPLARDRKIGMVGGEIHTLRTEPDNLVEGYCEQTGFLKVAGRCGRHKAGYYPGIERDLPHEVNGNVYSPFFATANAAVSKEAVEAIGREFWHELTSEDVDFSLRILKAGFRLYFEPEAIVDHMHRITLRGYCGQLYGYGFGHPLAVQKHARKILEFRSQYFGYFSIPLPLPCKGIIYIGDFHLMHLFGVLFVLSMIYALRVGGFAVPTSVFGLLFILFWLRYFGSMFSLRPRGKFLTWCRIRYLSNWALMLGGFKGMAAFKVIYIESSW